MSLPIIMHVNYCEQGQTLAEMCQKAVDWGYDGIEFRRKRSGVQETVEEYLDEIAKGVEKSGLKHVLFGGPGIDLVSPDLSVRKAQIAEGVHFYQQAAQRFHLTVCNVSAGAISRHAGAPSWDYHASGSGAATEAHYMWAAEGFRELGHLATELKFKMAFETHMGCLTDLPEPTQKVLDMIGSDAVGANLDYGNMVYFSKVPSLKETIATLSGQIFMVHLKNSHAVPVGDQTFMVKCPLGDGLINNREFLKLLRADGFDGPICIEAPRAGDREWFAQEDIAYLKSVLKDLAW